MNNLLKYLIVLLVVVSAINTFAAIIDIPADYATIQAGIDASSGGDTVLVQPGTYYENINFNGHNIVLGSLFLTTGDTSFIAQTIIDADTSVLGVSDTGSVVCFINGEDSTSVIKGFTLQNGIGTYDGYNDRAGGGIVCLNNSSPIIENNKIMENSAYTGGGIFCEGSSPTLKNNLIYANSAVDAGGIGCYFSSNSVIDGNIIEGNDAEYVGGGICCFAFTYTIISNNTISENYAGWGGGGIFCRTSCAGLINNNSISGNHADLDGGGIICRDYSRPSISENNISGNSARNGGGIHCSFDSSPNISENTIFANSANWSGGGIYCSDNSSPAIYGNKIASNTSTYYGGGIEYERSSPVLSGNTIIENSSAVGGGINCSSSSPIIKNNLLRGNLADQGGGIFCLTSFPTISNNTLTGNFVRCYGGAIYCYDSAPEIVNTILWANAADSGDNEIHLNETSSIRITYSDIDGGYAGESNIDSDPLFRDPENSDFHLMAIECDDPFDSPCIDMGYPDISDSLLDCAWGLGTVRSDMGAYSGGEGGVGVNETENELPKRIALFQNYPNPFNASTMIKYELPQQSRVTIDIYDILGRKVTSLINKQQPAGYHQAIWQADGFSSGMYFYKLQAGDYNETKKMLLLK